VPFSNSSSPTLTLLGCAGLLFNLWIWRKTRGGPELPGCGPASGCTAVLASRWSRWLGLPVALPGAMLYLIIVLAALGSRYGPSDPVRGLAGRAVVAAALLAGAAAVWFVALQLVAVRRLCAYCTVVHLLGACTCGLVLGTQSHVGLAGAGLATWQGSVPLLVAGVGLLCLVAGQLVGWHETYRLSTTSSPGGEAAPPEPTGQGNPVSSAREAPHTTRPLRDHAGRSATFLGGKVALSVEDWPRLGPADAPLLAAYLFDYTCPTCRRVHRLLLDALVLSRGRVAILLVPAPVDPTCNPHARRRTADHAHACRYARLGLDVWRHDAAKFVAYDRWVFEPADPPPIGVARNFAQSLVGAADLDPSVPDGELDALIAKGVEAYRASGAEAMPTILFPHAVLRGEVPSAARLAEIFREQMPPRAPALATVSQS